MGIEDIDDDGPPSTQPPARVSAQAAPKAAVVALDDLFEGLCAPPSKSSHPTATSTPPPAPPKPAFGTSSPSPAASGFDALDSLLLGGPTQPAAPTVPAASKRNPDDLMSFGSHLDNVKVARHEQRILDDLVFGGGPASSPQGLLLGAHMENQPYVPPRSVWELMSAYDILGVAPNADEAEFTQKYKRKALQLHPDKHPNQSVEDREYFKRVTTAFELLKDAPRRAEYDVLLRQGLHQF